MQKAVKYSSFLSYTLKPSHSLTQVFEKNRTAQEKLFKHMCNFGTWVEWREGEIVVSSYLDIETTKYEFRFLIPTPLACTIGYTVEGSIGYRDFKRLPQRRLNFIDGYISSYCSILNSFKRIGQISQANRLVSIICDL